MQQILKKLDLADYINSFSKLFARDKNIILEGDIYLHYRLITELERYNFDPPKPTINLDSQIVYLKKQSVLKIYEIFEFVKIVRYFLYLKRFNVEGKVKEWFDKIIIPDEIKIIEQSFTLKEELKEGINEDLDRINQVLYKNKEQIRQSLYKIINNRKLSAYLVDSQIHLVQGEETLLLRGGFNHVVKGQVLDRSSGGFFYVLPHSVNDLKQQQSNLINQKEEILFKICKEFSSTFNKWIKFLEFINKEFDRFDHYQARLFFAKSEDKNFILPSKNPSEKLIDFIHPALHDPKPITVDFSKSVIMITGVNAGGKTMLLKSILSAVVLSKYLIPYKADKKSCIGSYKNIVAVLDDPQSVKNDISTFAGRMVEFSKLFNKKNTIVGVDEIELGTDSDEAASLFKVIIEDLIYKGYGTQDARRELSGLKIIITTHHKRLAALMAADDNVELVAALYDEKNQRPTYNFLQGTIGKSYAFETASRYGIPKSVVSRAKEVYGDDKDKLNELIERSSELEREYKLKIGKLDSEIEQTLQLKQKLKNQKERIDQEIKEQKSLLHKQYSEAIEEAKKAIKIKQSKEGHKLLNIANKKVKQVKKVQKLQEKILLEVGDRVKYKNSKGILVSIKGKRAFVEVDGMRLQVPLNELKRSGNPPKIHPKLKANVNISQPKSLNIKLDLHGLRVDEAIEKLDKFISDALIAGFDEVLVYHGIGTGKLSYAVKEFLKSHPKVKSFEDAHPSQGGFGAKVIKL